MIRNEAGLFPTLKKILKDAGRPMSCVELYEMPEVRKVANSPNRVSDYLGGLWRKGEVNRLPAPKDSNSAVRWMYEWKKQKPKREIVVNPVAPYDPIRRILERPNIEIIEENGVVRIELASFTIAITPKT